MTPTALEKNQARFEFGENWKRFLALVNDQRIAEAEKSLTTLLGVTTLSGKSFLDIGSGSGLFSLAALRLGATVRSFDYDPQSVACAQELKHRYASGSDAWVIEQGSALDADYLQSLGTYDVVYSWGVLHHTGAMWPAIEQAVQRVKPQGLLAIALYNDQGIRSQLWLGVKVTYNHLPSFLQPAFAALFFPVIWIPRLIGDTLKGNPFRVLHSYISGRGMSPWRDLVDWVGGLPFEVAAPPAVLQWGQTKALELVRQRVISGHGCNEFVFRKVVK